MRTAAFVTVFAHMRRNSFSGGSKLLLTQSLPVLHPEGVAFTSSPACHHENGEILYIDPAHAQADLTHQSIVRDAVFSCIIVRRSLRHVRLSAPGPTQGRWLKNPT